MTRPYRVLGLLVLLGIVAGCSQGKAKQSQINQLISVVNETADLMATVKDEASAKSAEARLQQLMQKDKELQAGIMSKADVTKDEAKAVRDMAPELEKARARRMDELKRISAIPAVRKVLEGKLTPN